jgi:hypothetical protein
MQDFLQWIRSYDAAVVLEFVGPEDEMTLRLVKNKRNKHPDYTLARFDPSPPDVRHRRQGHRSRKAAGTSIFYSRKPAPASAQSAACALTASLKARARRARKTRSCCISRCPPFSVAQPF